MIIVGRKGKLSLNPSLITSQEKVWHRLEDALTTDVFGAYRYLPPAIGLLPFLRHAYAEIQRSQLGHYAIHHLLGSSASPANIDPLPAVRLE